MSAPEHPQVTIIPAKLVDPGPNDRQDFDATQLAELAASIRLEGLVQPPTVRPMGARYQIVCGERRVRAMRQFLEWDEIPCVVRELTDAEASGVMLAENVGRADLDPIEEARAYRRRLNDFGWTPVAIAERVGVPLVRVHDRLALLQLTPALQELVRIGQLPLRHAVRIYQLDADRQVTAVRLWGSQNLTWTEFVRLADRLLMAQQQDLLFDASAWASELEERPERSTDKRCPTCKGKGVVPS